MLFTVEGQRSNVAGYAFDPEEQRRNNSFPKYPLQGLMWGWLGMEQAWESPGEKEGA